MIYLILQITAYLAIAVSAVGLFVGIYASWRAHDAHLRLQGKHLFVATLSLLVYLGFTVPRLTPEGVEIFSITSIITLFFVLDTNFSASMTMLRIDYSERRGLLTTINIAVFFILAVAWVVHYGMGYDTRFYNYPDVLQAFVSYDLIVISRCTIFGVLLIFSVELAREIAVAYSQVSSELHPENAREHPLIRWAIITIGWGVLIVLFGIGQFVPSMIYHLCLYILVSVFMVQTVVGYVRFCLRPVKNNTKEEQQHDAEMEQQLAEWMHVEPFPLRETLSMEAAAAAAGVDRNRLSDYIYNDLGVTFTAWVRDCRLDHCRELLTTTNLTISQIADAAGYNELAALSKAFKQKYGIPPSKFRKQ